MVTKQAQAEKQKRLFDIQKESKRITQALANLKANEKPGEASGMVTKTVILTQNEAAIKELYESGYTVQQIAKAMTNDAFSILPKTITQLLNKQPTTRKKQPKRVGQPATDKDTTKPVATHKNTPTKSKQVTEIGDIE